MLHIPFLLLLATSGLQPGPCRSAADSTAGPDSAGQTPSHGPSLGGLMPVLWTNDYGGVTVGLRAHPACAPAAVRGMFLVTGATRGSASGAVGVYGRWNRVAGWSVEGRTGVALSFDDPDRHMGLDALWMATTNLGYLDRRLWDDAGTVEMRPWLSTATRSAGGSGETVFRSRLGARLGLVYRNVWLSPVSERRLHYDGFTQLVGEMSVRTPVSASATFGVRLFAGAYLGPSNPARQLRIPVAAADPYETFPNPLLRSRGALLVRPGFYYQAPGGANLRGFRSDLGGRWAVGVNLELTRAVAQRDAGLVREVALEAFMDLGLADTLAAPAASRGRWYTTLYDGGVGILTKERVGDLGWTMRLEAPLAVNRWDLAADDPANSTRFALRWLVSFEPSF